MGIYGMMRTGVAGMNAQANRLTGVADNVANVSTAGYKRTDTQFSDLVMPSTRNAYQSGGVTTTVRHDISMQGAGRGTGKPGDIMLEGNGFFRVQDESGTEYLTRAGSFQRNGQGYLQNAAGFYLLDETGKRVVIKGGAGELLPGKTTDKAIITANLQADMPVNTSKAEIPQEDKTIDPKSYDLKKFVTVYDSQGTAVQLDVYFKKVDQNKWEMTTCAPGADGKPTQISKSTLTFKEDGQSLASLVTDVPAGTTVENNTFDIQVPNVNGGTFKFNLDVNGLTQLGANFTFDSSQTGYAPGTYKNFSFNDKGEIQVSYSNSQVRTIGVVGLSTVTAPDSLIPVTGTVFQAVPEAGGQTFGHPGEGTFGVLRSGMLEESNADIGDELTDMIEAQRNYTANSKVFQTGSEVMDVIVNLKR
ncbi:flagellar hook protein FlgE [uncultured Bartonella sp.]|uniref:flagellar hook protein FlgE n=1 Tax=uncultured Bartonella sp. TaxID=104108 RepID=UPI0025FD6294|nr:flagellar hook protein FlgE [uncultured Bartonella sp.]